MKSQKEKTIRRKKRTRTKIKGERPRLCVFKSSKHIYAQLIDDEKGKVICSADDRGIKKGSGEEKAKKVGKLIAEKASQNKIEKVVFDRGPYKYHGKIKSLAEEARKSGLIF